MPAADIPLRGDGSLRMTCGAGDAGHGAASGFETLLSLSRDSCVTPCYHFEQARNANNPERVMK